MSHVKPVSREPVSSTYHFPFLDAIESQRKAQSISEHERDRVEICTKKTLPYTPTKPMLPSPKTAQKQQVAELRYISLLNKMAQTEVTLTEVHTKHAEETNEELQNLSEKRMKALIENAEKEAKANSWGMLQDMASSLCAASSVVVGTTALAASAASPLVCGALITSGVLVVGNQVLEKTESWDWVAQKLSEDPNPHKSDLSWILPTVLNLSCALISGSALIFSGGSTLPSFLENGMAIGNAALRLTEGGAVIAKGHAEAQLSHGRADTAEYDTQLKMKGSETAQIQSDLETHLQAYQNSLKAGERMIEMTAEVAQILSNTRSA